LIQQAFDFKHHILQNFSWTTLLLPNESISHRFIQKSVFQSQ
jgi:hypothetical protein